jgi:non-specific serine/threonine protein kinase
MPLSVTSRGSAGNLPAELTSFIGRRRERAEIKRVLADSRLVTLTGFGGVGKTRLALRAGADLLRAFRDGVWFVELATLNNPALLPNTVAKTVGLRAQASGAVMDALVDHLASRSVLLVLDNCEHLIDAAAALAETLLRACPDLHVLATSREPLGIGGETILSVAPLAVPAQDKSSAGDLPDYEAVGLFVDRARSANPKLVVNDSHRELITKICRRLDGIPLAIELAAVRLRGLSPTELLDRLANHFHLLNAGSRGAPDRQRTLRGCIDWSYQLCTPAERRLWAQASLFTGGFEIDAVEYVCGDETSGDELLDTLLSLVDKSILTSTEHSGRMRYRMLEVIRHYGEERLRETDQWTSLRRRHRDFYAGLAARSESEWIGSGQRSWIERMRREHPNLQAALDFCLSEPGEAEAGLDIAANIREHWIGLGALGEGAHWFERLLAADSISPRSRARALRTAAWLSVLSGDLVTAQPLIEKGTALARDLDERTQALMRQVAGMHALFNGDLRKAVADSEDDLALFRAAGDHTQEVSSLIMLQMAHGYAGDTEQALAWHAACLELTERTGDTWFRSYAMWHAGVIHLRRGDAARASEILRESLRMKRGLIDEVGVAVCIDTLASATAKVDPRRAAMLLGAAAARWEAMGSPVTGIPWVGPPHDEAEARLRAALGDAVFEVAYQQGAELDFDESLDFALDEKDEVPKPGKEAAANPLTRRESEVAALVTRGLSNKEIASALVIAQRTAETHVEHILTKLGFTSRAQIAAWMAGREA